MTYLFQSQLFFVVFLMVMATVTFYSNAHRYYGQCNSKLRFKNLPVNHTKGGRLAQDELRKEIRRRGVEFYHFFDNFQRSHVITILRLQKALNDFRNCLYRNAVE